LLDASGLSKSFGGRTLFSAVDLRLDAGDRLALVGPNGSGKTTLIKILAGEEQADTGEVRGRRGSSNGYLPQEVEVDSSESLLDFVENVAGELREVQEGLAEAHKLLDGGDSSPELLVRYGHLQARYEYLGGYTLRSEARKILSGLGFSERDFSRPLNSFSGGWRMRSLLARILLKSPEIIFLDEPTNHLDIVTLEWLENFIRESKAGFLIVSHDVSFLNRVVNGVFALEKNGAVRTKGNYDRYVEERDLRLSQQRAAFERQQRKRADEERFIERFRSKNTKAKQVQSRIKRMEKEEVVAPSEPFSSEKPAIRFPQPERSGKDVVTLDGVVAGYGPNIIYKGLDFKLFRGDKAVFIGPNGAGKSTLLKLIAGVIAPSAGTVTFGHNVTRSYFSQHQMELLSPNRTVLEEILALPGYRTEREARSLLGGFLFSGDDVEKKVSVLSGGEKSRLVMAKLLIEPGNLLLLDEPTNHLDIDACETLKNALFEFGGTIAVITHDRDLINRVANKVIYVDGGRCEEYLGNYDDFLRARGSRAAAAPSADTEPGESAVQKSSKGKEARKNAAKSREEFYRRTKPLRSRVEELEKKITEGEVRLAEVEAQLSDPGVYSDPKKAAELARERAGLESGISEASHEWEALALDLEELERTLREELELE
jgi:ATP-binding cassette subfamily F protein 3